MMPSSAATTSTTRSVAAAPRARMAEKAACPGVSRKVRDWREPGMDTSKAPMCWVMPPASCGVWVGGWQQRQLQRCVRER